MTDLYQTVIPAIVQFPPDALFPVPLRDRSCRTLFAFLALGSFLAHGATRTHGALVARNTLRTPAWRPDRSWISRLTFGSTSTTSASTPWRTSRASERTHRRGRGLRRALMTKMKRKKRKDRKKVILKTLQKLLF